jgi:hypothetical protein
MQHGGTGVNEKPLVAGQRSASQFSPAQVENPLEAFGGQCNPQRVRRRNCCTASEHPNVLYPFKIRPRLKLLRGKQGKVTAMPATNTPATPNVASPEVLLPDGEKGKIVRAAEPVEPLAAAKTEVDAAIDDLLLGYTRVRVARLRDAIDQLRVAIPSRPPASRPRKQ